MRTTLILSLSLFLPAALKAAPLTEARVTKIINIVDVVDPAKGTHPATVSEVIKDQIGLRTGSKSRSELMFNDNTLTRIGPETYFSFKSGTRDLTLQQGTLLLQVPKGIGGAKIRTAAVTASITGTTIMMEYIPSKSLKVLVLEGSLRLSRNGIFGDSLLLTPGKMVIMPPNAKHIPEPISVDLAHVTKTSALINMGDKKKGEPIPSISLINKEVERQAEEKTNNSLVDTNLVILGSGTDVLIGSDEILQSIDSRHNADNMLFASAATPTPFPTATPSPGASATPTPGASATPTPGTSATPTATPDPSATPTATATATPSVTPEPSGTPSPTATPEETPAPTPLPTPDPSATPEPSPITTLDPPPVNVAVTLDKNKTIEFQQPRVTGGVDLPGSFYKGADVDGPASWFVFGNSTDYDAKRDFDGRFGTNFDQPFPSGGVAVIRFDSISFAGPPQFLLNGPTIDLALIGDTGITTPTGGEAFSIDLSKLASLTLATNSGSITLDKVDFKATGSTLKFLQFYQRGTGDFSSERKIEIPSASFYIGSAGSLTLGTSSNLSAARALFNSDGTLSLNGQLSTGFLQLSSETAIAIDKKPVTPGVLYAYAPLFSTQQSLAVSGGNLDIGTGGISAEGNDLTGFENIITTGDLAAKNVTVTDQLSVAGTFFAGVTEGGSKISAAGLEMLGGLSSVGKNGSAGGVVTLNAPSILVDSGPGAINGINLNGGDKTTGKGGPGGKGGTLNIGTAATPIPFDVTVNVPITATTGANLSTTGGDGGTVNITSGGTVAVNSTIKVSDSVAPRASKTGGNITITSKKTTGTAITVSSSAQLLALLNSVGTSKGGTIKLTSAGGEVSMSGTATADAGTVEITNTGASGVVTVNNATLHGSTVKVGALGNNGTLNVGGGSIDAATTLKLYAGGSNGSVNFTDNVTLSGNSLKIIAADAVTIFNGKVVTVTGLTPASVFTNIPNYTGFGGNGTTTGTFGGNGAVTLPLSGAPGF